MRALIFSFVCFLRMHRDVANSSNFPILAQCRFAGAQSSKVPGNKGFFRRCLQKLQQIPRIRGGCQSGPTSEQFRSFQAIITLPESTSDLDSLEDQKEAEEAPKPNFQGLRLLADEFADALLRNETALVDKLTIKKSRFIKDEVNRLTEPTYSHSSAEAFGIPHSSQKCLRPNISAPLLFCAPAIFRMNGSAVGLPTDHIEGGLSSVPGLEGKEVVSVGAGWTHVIVVCSDGTVLTCGDNSLGQCGHGSAGGGSESLQVVETLRGRRAVHAASGTAHSVVVTECGAAWSFGDNRQGQCGAGAAVAVVVQPHRILFGPEAWPCPAVAAAACGAQHTVLLTRDGRVFACGRNDEGQLGLGFVSGWAQRPVGAGPVADQLLLMARGVGRRSGRCLRPQERSWRVEQTWAPAEVATLACFPAVFADAASRPAPARDGLRRGRGAARAAVCAAWTAWCIWHGACHGCRHGTC